jgi:WD40 repeat protein
MSNLKRHSRLSQLLQPHNAALKKRQSCIAFNSNSLVDCRDGLPNLSDDPTEATQQYRHLREFARETFQSFLRNLNSQSLRSIEHTFEENDGELDIATFLEMCPSVFPKPRYAQFPHAEEQAFIVQLAGKLLFEDIDVDQSGGADWMEFVNFVCAIAETLRIQAEEGTGTQFNFNEGPAQVVATTKGFRPQITKCLFGKLCYWPDHPAENVVVFEEGQSAFHLHKVKTMQRRKRCEGHRSDLLAATFMPEPYDWVVTSGNDKLLCFWDAGFSLFKKWKLEWVIEPSSKTTTSELGSSGSHHPKKQNTTSCVIGSLCWCREINALYFASQENTDLQAWRITDPMSIRASEKAAKPDKSLALETGHTAPIQQIKWLATIQCIATASLDTTVRIFDLVKMEGIHVFNQAAGGHTKGVTCLEYCPQLHILLSGGFNNYICLWDCEAGVRFHTFKGHECSVTAICAVPGTDNEVLSCDLHGVVKLWDLRRLQCVQSFHATDAQAEKSGEIEPLEPRTMCCLHRDRFLLSGRRMVAFERGHSQPQLTADSPIMAIAFSHRKFEIATSVKNNVRIWCALTGKIVAVHNHIIEGNITALALGLGERRCFVGSDKGNLCVINFACGAPLKTMTSHIYEVNQILPIPTKILTLSTGERLVRVHDDSNPERAVVLKEISLMALEPIVKISFDGDKIISAGTEDGLVVWFAIDYAKCVSTTANSIVTHNDAPISCCEYFQTAPLVATADSESCVILWSIAPLRAYEFFCKLNINLRMQQKNVGSSSPSRGTGAKEATELVGITCLVFSWPDEDLLIVGSETGSLACLNISSIVAEARTQRDEIAHRKEHGEASDVISGKIFESMKRPDESDVHSLPNEWLVMHAHRGSIDQIKFCKLDQPVILTMGFDSRVCVWSPETGAPLGTLEQGLPEGVFYERASKWHFPIDAKLQVKKEVGALLDAATREEDDDEQGGGGGGGGGGDASVDEEEEEEEKDKPSVPPEAKSQPSRPSSATEKKGMSLSHSSPALHRSKGGSNTPSRLLQIPKHRKSAHEDWFAGPLSKSYTAHAGYLPQLQSGCLRSAVVLSKSTGHKHELVNAARRLSGALAGLGTRSSADM